MAWFPWCHEGYTIQEADHWINVRVPSIWDSRKGCEFVITDHENRILGSCCLEQMDLLQKSAGLGYWVRKAETRKGIATKACLLLLDYGFSVLDLRYVDVVVSINNLASRGVAKKLPYERVWKVHDGFQVGKMVSDAWVYRISKPSFELSKSF